MRLRLVDVDHSSGSLLHLVILVHCDRHVQLGMARRVRVRSDGGSAGGTRACRGSDVAGRTRGGDARARDRRQVPRGRNCGAPGAGAAHRRTRRGPTDANSYSGAPAVAGSKRTASRHPERPRPSPHAAPFRRKTVHSPRHLSPIRDTRRGAWHRTGSRPYWCLAPPVATERPRTTTRSRSSMSRRRSGRTRRSRTSRASARGRRCRRSPAARP